MFFLDQKFGDLEPNKSKTAAYQYLVVHILLFRSVVQISLLFFMISCQAAVVSPENCAGKRKKTEETTGTRGTARASGHRTFASYTAPQPGYRVPGRAAVPVRHSSP